MDKSQCW